MWIILKKSYTLFNGKKLPMGKIFQVTTDYGNERIKESVAVKYEGPIPPVEKTKTDFFKKKI